MILPGFFAAPLRTTDAVERLAKSPSYILLDLLESLSKKLGFPCSQKRRYQAHDTRIDVCCIGCLLFPNNANQTSHDTTQTRRNGTLIHSTLSIQIGRPRPNSSSPPVPCSSLSRWRDVSGLGGADSDKHPSKKPTVCKPRVGFGQSRLVSYR